MYVLLLKMRFTIEMYAMVGTHVLQLALIFFLLPSPAAATRAHSFHLALMWMCLSCIWWEPSFISILDWWYVHVMHVTLNSVSAKLSYTANKHIQYIITNMSFWAMFLLCDGINRKGRVDGYASILFEDLMRVCVCGCAYCMCLYGSDVVVKSFEYNE